MFEILLQVNDLIFVDKPVDWLTVPSRFEDNDPRPILGRELEKKLNRRVWPVHRLDFEVSGVTLFALSEESHRRGNRWFEKKQVRKRYEAITGGVDFSHWPADLPAARAPLELQAGQTFQWSCKILRGKRRSYENPKGDLAQTEARHEGRDEQGRHRWSLWPLTGRPHQLRFEMSRHGLPIWGDELYGSKKTWPGGGIALRAVELDFSAIADRAELPAVVSAKGLWT